MTKEHYRQSGISLPQIVIHKLHIINNILKTTLLGKVAEVLIARSGLAIKKGIRLSNGIGVIDSDYRGEICVGLHNTGAEPFVVARGDRIAQMMFMPVYAADFITVDSLDETERGAGGFGSTGVK